MEFFIRMLSSNSRLEERAREAEQVNVAFMANLDNLEGILESEESTNVYALLDMIYEESFPEEQIFMKTPSRARLKSKKKLLVKLLIGLDDLGVPTMAEMLMFVRKHGLEGITESLVTLLELLSRFLEGKQAPEYTTDDVMNVIDSQWHSNSRTGSPLLNVIASATSSPRASAASLGDSPLNPIVSASPFRRIVSDRSMFLSRSHELGAKSVLDKTSTSSPHHPTLTVAASSKYPYFGSKEITSEIAASPEITSEIAASPAITLPSSDEKPPSYSLDTLPPSSEHATQRRQRRPSSSSLRQLFAEDTIDEVSWEGSIGASSKRNSSSSSWRRNSSEFPKVLINVSGSGPSSPINPGLQTGGGASDKEILSTIQTQDRKINSSSRKGSRLILPPQPYNEVALWREDIDGFTVDLASSNNENPAQTSADDAACKSPYQDGKPLKLHELEAEVHSSSVDYAAQCYLFEAGPQCKRDADFEEHARHAQSMDKNPEEDAKNATYLLDITNEDQPGQTSALDNYEGSTSASLDIQQQQNERESASDEINPEDSIQEGIGSPRISVAPLLLPSTSHVCEDAHDLPVNIHEGESLQGGVQQVRVGGEEDPFLNEQDDTRSPIYMSSLSLQNDKILNHMVGSISDEKEDIEMHASWQDLQSPLEAVDSNQYSPIPAANTTNDVPLSVAHARSDNITKVLPIEEERGHLVSYMLPDVPTTTSHAEHKSSAPSDGECSMQIDLSELLDNLHQDDHIEIEGNTKAIHNCEILSMDKNSFKDYVSSEGASMSSLNELDSYPVSHSLEEDMQKISPELMKEDDKKDKVQPMNLHVDDVQKISPELMKEDDKKDKVQPMNLHVDDVSRPCDVVDQGPCVAKAGLEEQLKCTDDQFEQLPSEIDAAEELGTALHASGEFPLIHAQSDTEGGKMGTHDNVQEGVPPEENLAREWEDERMRTDEKMRFGYGKIRSGDDSDKEIVFHTEGQFITGGPGHIPALANFDDYNHCMQDDSEVHEASPNLQDMESSLEQKLQDMESSLEQKLQDNRGFHESTDGSMHECPLENQLSLASLKSHEAYDEASSKKLDHDRQGSPYPSTIVDLLHEGELITPCWEASEVVDVSRSHPLHDDEDRMQRLVAQSTDPGPAAQFTDSGRHCAATANSLHDGDRIQRLATQVMDRGTPCADNVNSLHDDDGHIQQWATQFPDSRSQCAVNSSRHDSLQEDDDRSQLLAALSKDSGRQCAVNVSISYSLHDDDHIQRSARQFRGSRSSSDDDPKGPIHAGDVASLQDHEHQQFDNLCSPLSLSKKVDLQEANLHGHPMIMDPPKQTDQHLLNQSATYHDPTTIDRWDIDTEEARSERRDGGTSCVGRLARGCLSCCRKPHTNP